MRAELLGTEFFCPSSSSRLAFRVGTVVKVLTSRQMNK